MCPNFRRIIQNLFHVQKYNLKHHQRHKHVQDNINSEGHINSIYIEYIIIIRAQKIGPKAFSS